MGLTNTQYDELMREYSRRQNKVQRELDERRQEAYAKLPALSRLDSERADLAMQETLARLDGRPASDIAPLIRRISAQKVQILTDAGYAADYLDPQYTCPDCQDTGYINGEKCHCFEELAIERFYGQSQLAASPEETFAHFRLDYYPDELTPNGKSIRDLMRSNYERCLRFAQEFDTHSQSLLFTGGVGLGKTFLSHAIAQYLTATRHSVMYYSAYELFHQLSEETFGDGELAISAYLGSCDLLIIDDLGTEMTNSFVNASLFQILNNRIAAGKSTIISTNLSPAALNDLYSERSISRILSSFTILPFYGKDIRILKKLGH